MWLCVFFNYSKLLRTPCKFPFIGLFLIAAEHKRQ